MTCPVHCTTFKVVVCAHTDSWGVAEIVGVAPIVSLEHVASAEEHYAV